MTWASSSSARGRDEVSASSAPAASPAGDRYELTRELADEWGRLLWREFLEQFDVPWDGATVLDFGCGLGHLPMYLVERVGVAEAHGVDLHPSWEALTDGFRPQMLPGVRLHSGDVLELSALQRVRFDVIVSTGTLSLLRPTELMRVLQWFYDHLKPGGHCLIQTRTYAHHDGAELGEQAPPFAQLLFGRSELDAFLKRHGFAESPHVNPSCAATYLAQFARAGFALQRAERLYGEIDERLRRGHAAKLKWLDPEELRTSGLAVHLRRPAMPDLSIVDRRV